MTEQELKPIVIAKNIISILRNFSLNLLPESRKVALLFDDFNVLQTNVSLKPVGFDKEAPQRCIFLILHFIKIKIHQPLTVLFYYDNTELTDIIDVIKAVIDDIFLCADLEVIFTISSGKTCLVKLIDTLAPVNLSGARVYDVGPYKNIIHLFDPSWLIRQTCITFQCANIAFNVEGIEKLASYEDIEKLLNHKITSPTFVRHLKHSHVATTSAARTFSFTVGTLLHNAINAEDLKRNIKSTYNGTSDLCILFDNLFDSFNGSTETRTYKKLRHLVSPYSQHTDFWAQSLPIIESMTCINKNKKVKIDYLQMDDSDSEEIREICRNNSFYGQTDFVESAKDFTLQGIRKSKIKKSDENQKIPADAVNFYVSQNLNILVYSEPIDETNSESEESIQETQFNDLTETFKIWIEGNHVSSEVNSRIEFVMKLLQFIIDKVNYDDDKKITMYLKKLKYEAIIQNNFIRKDKYTETSNLLLKNNKEILINKLNNTIDVICKKIKKDVVIENHHEFIKTIKSIYKQINKIYFQTNLLNNNKQCLNIEKKARPKLFDQWVDNIQSMLYFMEIYSNDICEINMRMLNCDVIQEYVYRIQSMNSKVTSKNCESFFDSEVIDTYYAQMSFTNAASFTVSPRQ